MLHVRRLALKRLKPVTALNFLLRIEAARVNSYGTVLSAFPELRYLEMCFGDLQLAAVRATLWLRHRSRYEDEDTGARLDSAPMEAGGYPFRSTFCGRSLPEIQNLDKEVISVLG